MSVDLYETLGVDKDADEAAIKRAYRQRSLETHPDGGGDVEEFKRVNHAYKVLSSPLKRERYDKNGDDGEATVDPALAILGNLITQITGWMLSSGKDPKTTDILDLVRAKLGQDSGKILAAQKENLRRIDKLKEVARRLGLKPEKKRRKKGKQAEPRENLLAKIVLGPVPYLEAEVRSQEAQLEQFKAALNLLDGYEYQVEQGQMSGVMGYSVFNFGPRSGLWMPE